MQVALKRVALVLACLGSSLAFGAHAFGPAPAQGCASLVIAERGDAPTKPAVAHLLPRITIEAAGHYCLDRDVHQASLWDPTRGSVVLSRDEAIIRLRADDVSLDLGGRTVSNAMPDGLTIIWFSKFAVGERNGVRLRKATLRNGHLVSPGPSGVGIDLTASKAYGPNRLGVAAVPPGTPTSAFFADTRHLIESITIAAGRRGILIDGANNVIRNSRIVVDGITAIVAHGPGIVIEDNVIEVRNDRASLGEHGRKIDSKTPYVIRLIQADGAIIRNNEIRVSEPGRNGPLPAAIDLVESADVLVEANRIRGMETTVRADAGTTHRDVGNLLEVCPPGATRFLASGEADPPGEPRHPACSRPGGPQAR